MEYIFSLGSHPALSAAEIYNFVTKNDPGAVFDLCLLPKALVVKTKELPQNSINELGGTPFFAQKIATLDDLRASEIIVAFDLKNNFANHKKPLLALSFTSDDKIPVEARFLRKIAMEIKRELKLKGFRFIVPQKGSEFSSAQLFNAEFPNSGIAIQIFQTKDKYVLGKIAAVQNLNFYTERDRQRPEVDPGKGMLPVKIAQILINLSMAPKEGTIFDPFCGTGTIVSEGILKGLNVIASDISPKQVERTNTNVKWLAKDLLKEPELVTKLTSFVQDIDKPLKEKLKLDSIDAIVSEGWLGPAINRTPSLSDAEKTFFEVQKKIFALLQNVRPYLKKDGYVVVTLPAFRVGKRIIRAPFLQPEFLKLWPKSFKIDTMYPENWDHEIFRETNQGQILYGRPDAIVLRDILRLKIQ